MRAGKARASRTTQSAVAVCLLVVASLLEGIQVAKAATVTTQADDPISIVGTWATGSGQVETGLNFFNPLNDTFNIPAVGGQAYSFTEDGFYEEAQYIFTSDPATPNCAQAQLIWQHGNFSQNANGSLTLTPFVGDGRQMIQNGCTQVSSAVSYYGQDEYFEGFYIRLDWHFGSGGYYLQLYEFDGTPKPWMWQTYNPPQMLPTETLTQQVYGSLNNR